MYSSGRHGRAVLQQGQMAIYGPRRGTSDQVVQLVQMEDLVGHELSQSSPVDRNAHPKFHAR
jgi:hypothetical protein